MAEQGRSPPPLAASPFCLVATAGADGSCDVSPKGDPPGFTLVLDDRTIAVPEPVAKDIFIKIALVSWRSPG